MSNIDTFERQVRGKPAWDRRDWITFVNTLYNDVSQDPRLVAIKNRLPYEFRGPTIREIHTILDVLKDLYTENNLNKGELELYTRQVNTSELFNLNRIVPSVDDLEEGDESLIYDPIIPTSLSNLEVWIDAEDYPVGAIANGATITNKGTGPGNFTVSGTGLSVEINEVGRKQFVFGGAVALNTTNQNWFVKYHNITTSTQLIFIGKIGATSDPDAVYGICGNNGSSSLSHGFAWAVDNRVSQPTLQGINYYFTKAVASTFPARVIRDTPSPHFNFNTRISMHVNQNLGLILDFYRIWINGDIDSIWDRTRLTGETTSGLGTVENFSATNPTYVFQIGAIGNNTAYLVGKMEQFIMYAGQAFSDVQVRGMDSYFRVHPTTFGKGQSGARAKYITHTQTISDQYILSGFYHKTADKSKTLFHTSRGPSHFGVGDDRNSVQVLSTNDAVSFPASYTVVDSTAGTSPHAGLAGGILPSGRTIITYGKYNSTTGVYIGMYYRHSENHETWGSEVQITVPVTAPVLTSFVSHDQGVLADNGDMIIPWYGISGTSLYNVYVMRVSGNGTIFSHKLVYTSPTIYKNECSVANLGNSKWVLAVRVEDVANIVVPPGYVHEYFLSEDDCETWVSLGQTNHQVSMWVYPHPPMLRTFMLNGTKVLAAYFVNRGRRRWYVSYVTVADFLANGISAFTTTPCLYQLDLRLDGVNATGWRTGYPVVIHPDNDIKIEGVYFEENSPSICATTFFKMNDDHALTVAQELGI